ncbi:MAG: DNA polymerase III subunit chi [Salaquimonas sp.]
MAEVLFYHLTERTLEQTLPGLLEKCLERNWKSLVQFGDAQKLANMDSHLWTYRDDAFLPHSLDRNGAENEQPIFLTTELDNPNEAEIRFMVEGATPPSLEAYTRGIYIFDGHNEVQLSQARERWKIEKAAGHDVTYWQQGPKGGWEKKA